MHQVKTARLVFGPVLRDWEAHSGGSGHFLARIAASLLRDTRAGVDENTATGTGGRASKQANSCVPIGMNRRTD
jgi:hypothetical protein